MKYRYSNYIYHKKGKIMLFRTKWISTIDTYYGNYFFSER